jgi:hypothetical protein
MEVRPAGASGPAQRLRPCSGRACSKAKCKARTLEAGHASGNTEEQLPGLAKVTPEAGGGAKGAKGKSGVGRAGLPALVALAAAFFLGGEGGDLAGGRALAPFGGGRLLEALAGGGSGVVQGGSGISG